MTPYAPPQQQPMQQQGPLNPEEGEFLGEMLRAIAHLIAEDMHSDLINQLAAIGDTRQLTAVLRARNDQNEIRIRNKHQQPQAAPQGPRPRSRFVRQRIRRKVTMSRDHAAKDWSSWNRDGADADTRHYQPSNPDELKYHFENLRILNALEVLQKEAPELAAKIWAGDSDATEALKKLLRKRVPS